MAETHKPDNRAVYILRAKVKRPYLSDRLGKAQTGLFFSHIMSQHYALNVFINMIQGSNVKLIELNDLNTFLNYNKIMNKKYYNNIPNNMILSDMKKNQIIISEETLTEEQKNIILNMYTIDIDFIKELESRFVYIY